MRRLLLALTLVLVLVPAAAGRVAFEPTALELAPGETRDVTVRITNERLVPLNGKLEARGDGVDVTLERNSVSVPPGENRTVRATLRALAVAREDAQVEVDLFVGSSTEPVDRSVLPVRLVAVAPSTHDATGVHGPSPLAITGAAGVVGAATAAVAVVAWRRWSLLGVALYARIERRKLAAHPARARLLTIVQAQPGIQQRELQRRAGLANGPFEHHLRKLVDAGLLAISAHEGQRHVHLPGQHVPQELRGIGAQALDVIRNQPRIQATDLARRLGVSRQALHYHIQRLVRAGLVHPRLERGRLVLEATRTSGRARRT